MASPPRKCLTKSRYKLALECPTKLYYAAHDRFYENTKLDDAFLKALARGGFQVGELAKLYMPGGVEITSRNHDEAANQTAQLLQADKVVIYEAALRHGDFFVKVDILVKTGATIHLYEVKAKSYHPGEDSFYDRNQLKKGVHRLTKDFKEYLYDIAFQTHVARLAYPAMTFLPYLTFVDKSKQTSVDGLNQKFFIGKEGHQTKVSIRGETHKAALGTPILINIPANEAVSFILEGRDGGNETREKLGQPSFAKQAEAFAALYVNDTKAPPVLSKECKKCEFQSKNHPQLKDGRKECWRTKLSEEELSKPLVLNLWNYSKTDDLIAAGKYLMTSVTEEDLSIKDDKIGLSQSQRQWKQVEYASQAPGAFYFDRDGLAAEMREWTYPLNFIDFETATVALPFHKGRRPYEQIAFQFSHHVMLEDGTVGHVGEYLHDTQGELPNFHFVRALKATLETNGGTIFRYSNHENTVLCQIHKQLRDSDEPDRDTLMAWIETITVGKEDKKVIWEGPRKMVDLCDLVMRYCLHPAMNGSYSIKYVLPAILGASDFLQEKYGKPIYGAKDGIKSSNFRDRRWLEKIDGKIVDPYKALGPIFKDYDLGTQDLMTGEEDALNNGGAASTAFARMQFTEMSMEERTALRAALLKYCELDTLAMVMIYEAWVDWIRGASSRQVARKA